MTNKIEYLILKNLISDENYTRKVLPFIKSEYFTINEEQIIFKLIDSFVKKYNKNPTLEILEVSLQESNHSESLYNDCVSVLKNLEQKEPINIEWLEVETEKFCKDKAVYNAIVKSITILEGKDKQHSKEGIPSLLQEALGVCFDSSVGHDYIDDASMRYDFYHRVEHRIPFDIDLFNKITEGGLPNKTLNVALAGTGVGKSLFMCHVAASVLAAGRNVLYITLEMAEQEIAKRLDANLLNIEIGQLKDLPKSMYDKRMDKIRAKTNGKLIIKEYPTSGAHANHFKSLLNELFLKKQFKPDIVFIDYLNICVSSRFKPGGSNNSYTIVKAIAEELRGLAVEYNLPVVTATQTTRSGYSNTDVDLTDTSESFGLPATADFMFAMISTEELEQLNQIMIKQLKNRYSDPTLYKRFMVGIDKTKMRLHNLEQSAQSHVVDSGIIDDDDKLQDFSFSKMFQKKDFSGIKI